MPDNIGVDSANTALIKQYAAQNNYTLWRIDRTTSGNLTFKCKISENTTSVLAVPSSSAVNGADLQQLVYSDDIAYIDEWYLIEKVISCVNYYDSSFATSSALLQNIPIANKFSNLVYSKYFNVGMYMDGTASQYATVIDSCATGINSQCSSTICGSDCNALHHKNGLVISNQLYYADREDDHIYVLWTDRAEGTYCHESSNQHTSVEWIAVVYGKRPVIHFMTLYGNENVELACMTLNMVHETAHTLKMNDVYDKPGHDVNGATVCVMERFDLRTAYEFYIDVLNNRVEPFCASCRNQLEAYTSNISILGN